MNYREKLQKFSIRKYTVGAFSTVIATLIFLGSPQAHASEQLQKDGQGFKQKLEAKNKLQMRQVTSKFNLAQNPKLHLYLRVKSKQ